MARGESGRGARIPLRNAGRELPARGNNAYSRGQKAERVQSPGIRDVLSEPSGVGAADKLSSCTGKVDIS